jgi:ATP-dependent RNA helicase DHX29
MLDDEVIVDSDEDVGGDLIFDSTKRYSKQTRTTLENIDENVINFDLIVTLLETVCTRHAELVHFAAATLIFMPSLESIRRLTDMLESHPVFGGPAYRIFPLHSTISNDNQGLVFDAMPWGVRKIVIATSTCARLDRV